jgi:hypothetical protein
MYYWMSDLIFLACWCFGLTFYIPTLAFLYFRQQENNRLLVEQMREERRMLEAEAKVDSPPLRRYFLPSEDVDCG